jgi:acyl-coenzyme A thioesterase PaaI-like protein
MAESEAPRWSKPACLFQSGASTQLIDYFHGGVTSAIADNAGGAAAYTLFPPGSNIGHGRAEPSITAIR